MSERIIPEQCRPEQCRSEQAGPEQLGLEQQTSGHQQKVVRVTGERNGMIQFDYGLDDLAYALELILPPDAFEAFCRENAVVRLEAGSPSPEPQDEAERGMMLRISQAGLTH